MVQPGDEELLEAWRSGDRSAGEELTRRHYHSILRFFELRTRAADDLTQRTFLACVEGRERFAMVSSFRAYLFGIARHQLLKHLRDSSRLDQMAQFADSASPGTSLSTIVARREEQHILLRAMASLPTDLQIVLELHYWEGMMAREIAEVLGIPVSTVTTRTARAREKLLHEIGRLTQPGRLQTSLLRDLDPWVRSLAAKPHQPSVPQLAHKRRVGESGC